MNPEHFMNDDKTESKPREVELYRHEDKTVVSSITARILLDGTLVISGYDCGPMCREVYSHDDLDSEVTVAAEDKDQLLLVLLKAKFGGDSMASSKIREFLDKEGVPWDLDTWP